MSHPTILELMQQRNQDPNYTQAKLFEVSDLVAEGILDLKLFEEQIYQAWEGRYSGGIGLVYGGEKAVPFIDPEIDGMLTRMAQITFEHRMTVFEDAKNYKKDPKRFPKTYKDSMLFKLFFEHTRQELENIPGFLESLLAYNLEDRPSTPPYDLLEKKSAELHDSGYVFARVNIHELHLIAMHGNFFDMKAGYPLNTFKLSKFAEWIQSQK